MYLYLVRSKSPVNCVYIQSAVAVLFEIEFPQISEEQNSQTYINNCKYLLLHFSINIFGIQSGFMLFL